MYFYYIIEWFAHLYSIWSEWWNVSFKFNHKSLLNITESPVSSVEYTDDNIRHLDDMEHIRVRSGMYIGRLGDGSQNDDGIYVLLQEVMDNSIDEFKMGAGKRIEVTIEDSLLSLIHI